MGDMCNGEMIVHFMGERPGTGINQMSAYITYGREGNEKNPKRKWNQQMEHCLTSLISGINPKGKGYIEATNEIIEIIKKGLKYKITGVDLSKYIK